MHHPKSPRLISSTLLAIVIICVAILPLTPVASLAAEAKEHSEVVVLNDQSKTPSSSSNAEKSSTVETTDTNTQPEPQVDVPEDQEKKMSTGMKVAIGVGAGVVAIAGIAALGGGSGDSSPTPPTPEQMVGAWQANANSADGRTYTGTYTLFAGGSHTYDIYVSDGRHKTGNGSWSLVDYNLTVRNYNGSTYNGTFAQGVKNTVTLGNTAGTWKTVLTKQ